MDTTGTILKKWKDGDSLRVTIQLPRQEELLKCIVKKGYIAIDGVSLTITDVDAPAATFSFMLVPHTQASIIMPHKEVGARVNLEVDVMAKYALRAASSSSSVDGVGMCLVAAMVATAGGATGYFLSRR